jgi:hypothetical protein
MRIVRDDASKRVIVNNRSATRYGRDGFADCCALVA